MGLVLGLNAKTYINSGPDLAAPVWEEVDVIRDETLSLETSLSDVTTRRAKGWRQQVPTLSEGTVDGQLLYDTDDPNFILLRDAFFNKGLIELALYDGPSDTPGSEGLIGGFSVTTFSIGRELEEASKVDVTFTVREDNLGNPPEWDTIPPVLVAADEGALSPQQVMLNDEVGEDHVNSFVATVEKLMKRKTPPRFVSIWKSHADALSVPTVSPKIEDSPKTLGPMVRVKLGDLSQALKKYTPKVAQQTS